MTIVVVQQVASALVWGWGIAPAAAHGPLAASAAVKPDTLWRSWSFDPHVLAPQLLVVFGLYARGVRRLWDVPAEDAASHLIGWCRSRRAHPPCSSP